MAIFRVINCLLQLLVDEWHLLCHHSVHSQLYIFYMCASWRALPRDRHALSATFVCTLLAVSSATHTVAHAPSSPLSSCICIYYFVTPAYALHICIKHMCIPSCQLVICIVGDYSVLVYRKHEDINSTMQLSDMRV